MIYAVMEAVGNFSHTIAEFDTRDEAAEFIRDRAMTAAKAEFEDGTMFEYVQTELEIELENALSYYSIEEWSEC